MVKLDREIFSFKRFMKKKGVKKISFNNKYKVEDTILLQKEEL